ncbi:MAG TPA: hypothetical protein DEP72_07925 [Clostridiales bacterium]|nr:MAG: hypothetical protein A2Y18_06630 [Clostridiales bacterium GWD2_32_19]HCC08064.1 hypothetical protein [Clostridiales bacterium]
MKVINKYLLLSLLVILMIFCTFPVSASTSEYVISNYDVNLTVNENNTLNIIENIVTYFKIDKHGIFRKIPLKNEVIRLDGTKSYNRAKISDIKVSDNYTTYNEAGNKVIKIGNPDYTLTGEKDYTISYSYNIGKDTGKGYDELYFNLIGTGWDTTISNVTFTINMPKEFDKNKLGFSAGNKNSIDNKDINYTVVGKQIKGNYSGVLEAGEALTVRLELPDGYFALASNNFDYLMLLAIFLPIIFTLICFLMWMKYGKDDNVVETVEFYPIEGFNSAELGFIYKGKADKTDVTSLIIYLANKGYIKITETEEKSLFFMSKTFKIIKLRDYDGDNKNERVFFHGLFKSKDEVTASDLYDKFYITIEAIVENLNKKENKEKIMEKSSLGKRSFVIIMIVITFLVITIKPIVESGGVLMLPFALLFPGIGFTVLFAMVFGKTPVSIKIFGLIWGLIFGGVPWTFIVLPALQADEMYLLAYIIGIACILVMLLFFKAMPKRTNYGNEMLGKIRGFKNFLETAEKPQLEALVMEDPSYFYNILPYTYVLGVSDKWIKKFESISLQSPNWYDGSSSFNMLTFGSFMSSTMSFASSAMSSGSSSSGGGSSGGGSGGGGGGSW